MKRNADSMIMHALATQELGVEEIPGPMHNSRILQYHRETGIGASDDEEPWCAVFANWVAKQAGLATTGSPAARSFLRWGKETEPHQGCIVVLSRGSSSWQGHVGFLESYTDETVYLIGGNQNNRVSIQGYPMSKVLGFRAAKRPIDSTTIWAGGGAAAAAGGIGVLEAVNTVEVVSDKVSDITDKLSEGEGQTTTIYVLVAVVIGAVVWIVRERRRRLKENQI